MEKNTIFEKNVKALIKQMSKEIVKEGKSIINTLYNVKKSNKRFETITSPEPIGTFTYAQKGRRVEYDAYTPAIKKTVGLSEHTKQFVIPREMVDDSEAGISVNIKNCAESFVREYHKTKERFAAWALINGTKKQGDFNGKIVDLALPNGLPLFHKEHLYLQAKSTSNRFYANIMNSNGNGIDIDALETAVIVVANRIRNFKDENGDVSGCSADTIIIPSNRPLFEAAIKKVCGPKHTIVTSNNDTIIQCGSWSLVILSNWQTDSDKMIVMSSKANKDLAGNVFFDGNKLKVPIFEDIYTRNLICRGECNFTVGFSTWRHIALCEFSTTPVEDATELE